MGFLKVSMDDLEREKYDEVILLLKQKEAEEIASMTNPELFKCLYWLTHSGKYYSLIVEIREEMKRRKL